MGGRTGRSQVIAVFQPFQDSCVDAFSIRIFVQIIIIIGQKSVLT